MHHAVTALNRKPQHLGNVFHESGRADPASQVAAAYIFQKQERLTLDAFHHAGLGDIGVNVQPDPRQGFAHEAIGHGGAVGEYLVLERFGRKRLTEGVIVNNVDNSGAALENLVDLPAAFDQIACAPSLSHSKYVPLVRKPLEHLLRFPEL